MGLDETFGFLIALFSRSFKAYLIYLEKAKNYRLQISDRFIDPLLQVAARLFRQSGEILSGIWDGELQN